MLEAAQAMTPRPRIVCSVRDILVEPDKPERVEEMLARIERHYDLVLVHGDPALIPFDKTFPLADRIADRIRYTGYVVEEGAAPRAERPRVGVVVSAGGGAVSEDLFRAAMAARPLTRLKDAPWRILCGHALPEPAYQALRAEAPGGVTVERARPDFTALLRGAALSISQGGYNTMIETLAVADRAVIVPYAGGLETEQELRAELLAERGILRMVPEASLSPPALADATGAALSGPSIRSFPRIDTAGITTTLSLIQQWLGNRS
jgi:predicted glycosyltransferase